MLIYRSELKNIDVTMLFQKFYTVDSSGSNGNTGLGSYIVKELLDRMEGGIKEMHYIDNILTISVYFKLYDACYSMETTGGNHFR